MIIYALSIFLWRFFSLVAFLIILDIQLLHSPKDGSTDQTEEDCGVDELGETWKFVEWHSENLDLVLIDFFCWWSFLGLLFFFSDGHLLIELLNELDDAFLVGSQGSIKSVCNGCVIDCFEKMEQVSRVEVGVLYEKLLLGKILPIGPMIGWSMARMSQQRRRRSC